MPLKDPVKRAAYDAARRKANPEKMRADDVYYRSVNREKLNVYDKEWRAKHPDKVRDQNLKKYGITTQDFNTMVALQGDACAICGVLEPRGRGTWSVDHCHETGKVRGLVCHYCNLMLGYAKDSRETLLSAVEYLDRSKNFQKIP